LAAGEPVVSLVDATINYNLEPAQIAADRALVPSTDFVEDNKLSTAGITTGAPSVPVFVFDASLARKQDYEQTTQTSVWPQYSRPNSVEVHIQASNKVVI